MSCNMHDEPQDMYVLYEQQDDGEYHRVFSSTSLSYVQLKMRHMCQAYDHCDLEVPTFKIEVE